MNLQQLRYICEISRLDLNVSAAAAALHTSQPGVSKQLRLLEDELGMEIFRRARGRLIDTTPNGQRVIDIARGILREVANIKAVSREVVPDAPTTLVVAVTHSQARYVLPEVIKRYSRRHPNVQISMRHANPEKIISMLLAGEAELGISADDPPKTRRLTVIPCRYFRKMVVVPAHHPLLGVRTLTLKDLAQYPLVTYEPGFTSRRHLMAALEAQEIAPTIAVSAIDADVIKACVEQGLGVALLSEATFDPGKDGNLRAIPAGHLFPPSVSKIIACRDHYLRQCARDFIELCTENDPSATPARPAPPPPARSGTRRRADKCDG